MNAQTLLLLTTGFASEETTNNIKNISTILAIVIAVFTILKEIKGVSNIFGTKCNLPESLYFTQSYDSRVRKKKARIRQSRFSLLILYFILLAMLFSVGHVCGHEIVSQVSIFAALLATFLMLALYIRTELLVSKRKKCQIGDNAKLCRTGGLAFLISFLIFTSLSYTLSIGLLAQIEVNILVAAIIIGIIAIVLFVPIYIFHMDCMVSHDREEAIALGYVMSNNKQEFFIILKMTILCAQIVLTLMNMMQLSCKRKIGSRIRRYFYWISA